MFYVMDQANVPSLVEQFRANVNHVDSVDYQVALLSITGPGGHHPLQIVKQFVDFGILPKARWPDAVDRNAVLVVSDDADLAERWPLLAAARTDFVKVFPTRKSTVASCRTLPPSTSAAWIPGSCPWLCAGPVGKACGYRRTPTPRQTFAMR